MQENADNFKIKIILKTGFVGFQVSQSYLLFSLLHKCTGSLLMVKFCIELNILLPENISTLTLF